MMAKESLLFIASMLFTIVSFSQSGYVPAPENLKYRQQFQDDKFCVSIHSGIHNMMADGECVKYNENLNYVECGKLAGGFYPSKFNAVEWVADVKASEAKYICITSRHHDGFRILLFT